MSLSLTIRGGTTREYPQTGEEDWGNDASNWAQDATIAINGSFDKSETPQYDAIVGSSTDVTNGIATHTTLAAAIAAVSAGDRIFILGGNFVPAAQVDVTKALTIVGSGDTTVFQSDNIATGATIKISASGVSLINFRIDQNSGTPDYAVEIAAALERTYLQLSADGTFAVGTV